MNNIMPFRVVSDFEKAIAEYTGSPYAVAVDSCTNAIFLALEWCKRGIPKVNKILCEELTKWEKIYIDPLPAKEKRNAHYRDVYEVVLPLRTYLSVPQSCIRANRNVEFYDYEWLGRYRLWPYPIWDSAKWLTSNMYIPNSLMCLSFHHKKPLPIGKGGMILTDDKEAHDWLQKIKYEGRTPGKSYWDDDIEEEGFNHYMTPEQASRGLTLLSNYPQYAQPQTEPDPGYRPLTEFSLFKNCEVLSECPW